MGIILNWSSNYPSSVDDTVTNFPTVTDGVHDVLASHVNALAEAVIALEQIQETKAGQIEILESGVSVTSDVKSIDFVGGSVTNSSGDITVSVSGTLQNVYEGGNSVTVSSTFGAPTLVGADSTPVLVANDGTNDTFSLSKEGVLTLRETVAPTAVADYGKLYTKDIGGTTNLYFQDSGGTEWALSGEAAGFTSLQEAYTIGNTITTSAANGPVIITGDQQLLLLDGAAGTPAYSFVGAADTGVFHSSGRLKSSVGGVTAWDVAHTFTGSGGFEYGAILTADVTGQTSFARFASLHVDTATTGRTSIGDIQLLSLNVDSAPLFTFHYQGSFGITETSTPPTGIAGRGFLYTADDGGTTHLYFQDGADVTHQLTGGGAGWSLQEAYEAGNTITTDAAGGSFTVTGTEPVLLGPVVHLPDGSVGSPSLSFAGDPTSGIYDSGVSGFDFAVGGAWQGGIYSSSWRVASRIIINAGTALAPAVNVSGSSDTGMYWPSVGAGVGEVAIAANAIEVARFTAPAGADPQILVPDGLESAPAYSFVNSPSSGIYKLSGGGDTWRLVRGGAWKLEIISTGVRIPSGDKYAWGSNEYIYTSGSAIVTVSGGVETLQVQPTRAYVTEELHVEKAVRLGEVTTPTNATDKGFIYGKDVSTITELFYLDSDGNEVQLTSSGTTAESLQTAYEGGSTIDVTSAEGSVSLSNTTDTDTTTVLALDASPPTTATEANVLTITKGANATGYGLLITDNGAGLDALRVVSAGSASAIRVTDGVSSLFHVTGAGRIRGSDGATSSPTWSFISDSQTGAWLNSGQYAISQAGTERVRITSNAFRLTDNKPIEVGDGSTAAPSFTFIGSQTGLFRNATGYLVAAVDNANVTRWINDTVNVQELFGSLRIQAQGSLPSNITGYGNVYTKDPGTGVTELFYRNDSGVETQITSGGSAGASTLQDAYDGGNEITLAASTPVKLIGSSTNADALAVYNGVQQQLLIDYLGRVRSPGGSVTQPSLTWNTQTTTGAYLDGNGTAFTSRGTLVGKFTTDEVNNDGTDPQLLVADGGVAAPAIGFVSNPDLGFYTTVSRLWTTINAADIGYWDSTGLKINSGKSLGRHGNNGPLTIQGNTTTTSSAGTITLAGGNLQASTAVNNKFLAITGTVNQSSAVGATYTALYMDVTETAIDGSPNYLMDLRVGGATQFNIENTTAPISFRDGGMYVAGSDGQRFVIAQTQNQKGLRLQSKVLDSLNPILSITDVGDLTASSGTQDVISVSVDVSQTSTAGYSSLSINMNELTTGSGPKRFIAARVGGVNRFEVYTDGTVLAGDGLVTTPSYSFVSDDTSGIWLNTGVRVSHSGNEIARFTYGTQPQLILQSGNNIFPSIAWDGVSTGINYASGGSALNFIHSGNTVMAMLADTMAVQYSARFLEQASAPSNVASTGFVYAKDDATAGETALYFLSDLGTEYKIGGPGAGATLEVKEVTTDTYTLLASDENKLLLFNHASGCTVTVPDTLDEGFQVACRDEHGGSARTNFVAGGTLTLSAPDDHVAVTGRQGAVVVVVVTNGTASAEIAAIYGDLEAATAAATDLQTAYEGGNTITTNATDGPVTIAGTESLILDRATAFDIRQGAADSGLGYVGQIATATTFAHNFSNANNFAATSGRQTFMNIGMDLAQNDGGGTAEFTALRINAYKDASHVDGAENLLLDLQTTSSSVLKVRDDGQMQLADGSSTDPSLSFLGSPTSGFYSPSSDQVVIGLGGFERFRFVSSQVRGKAGDPTSPTYSFINATSSGLYHLAGSQDAVISAEGQEVVRFTAPSGSNPQLLVADGSISKPSLSFNADDDTGFHSPDADELGVTTGGIGYTIANRAVQTTDNTETTIWSMTLDDESVYHVIVDFIARDQSATSVERGVWRLVACVYRESGGSATIQSSVETIWNINTIHVNTTIDVDGNDVRARVTGASITVNWRVMVRVQKVA